MTQVWQRRISVGLMAVHASAFAAYWLWVGLMLVGVGEGAFYQTLIDRPISDQLEFFKPSYYLVVILLWRFWIWTLLFMIHLAIFIFLRRRNTEKLKHELNGQIE
jgi:hypothetical protein